ALVHSTEKTLQELGDKVSDSDRKAVEAAMSELKTAAAGEDASRIAAKADDLAKAAMKLGEALYRQSGGAADAAQAGSGGPAGQGGTSGSSDGVVDAEFEEVKDDE